MRTVQRFLKKLKTELPYDLAIPTLGHITRKKHGLKGYKLLLPYCLLGRLAFLKRSALPPLSLSVNSNLNQSRDGIWISHSFLCLIPIVIPSLNAEIADPLRQLGFPGGSVVKNLPATKEMWVRSLGREDHWRRKWQPTPVFLPGKSHGQRNLSGYSPWHQKESDAT